MSEGTRLGEFGNEAGFNPAVSLEGTDSQSLKPTKIGELSEFERSLMAEFPEAAGNAANKDDFGRVLQQLVADYKEGDVITGVVREVEKAGILLDIGYKSDGFIPTSEYSNDPDVSPVGTVKPGDEIKAVIEKLESKEGYTVLSRKRAEYEEAWNALSRLSKSKEPVSVRIASKVQGGLVASYMGIKGFIPASQVIQEAEEELSKFVGQTLELCVLQVDRKRRKVVFAKPRQSKSKANRELAQQVLQELEIGQVRSGKVSSIKDFGAFVDLGGVEGLVHISEMSWARVPHPSEKVKVGDTVNVFVLGIDREAQKVSLGMKQLEADPWVKVVEKYEVGQVVEGTVTRIVTFGAFIKLEENLEGLVHISELASKRVAKVEDVLRAGQQVQARIIKLSPADQRIGLSIRQLHQQDEPKAQVAAESVAQEPAAQTVPETQEQVTEA